MRGRFVKHTIQINLGGAIVSDQETNWITLVDEEGQEHRFNLLNIVEVEDAKYAVMVPETQENEEEEEAVIFKIETDEKGEEVLVDIEDDDEFAKVCEALEEMIDEEDETNED
jgi:putative Holliday junction resolvase